MSCSRERVHDDALAGVLEEGRVWEFLSSVLEKHGLVAVIVLATYAGLGVAIRELWRKNHEQAKEATERETRILKEESDKRSRMREEHDREIAAIKAQMRDDARHYAEHIDKLHEKRNDELREVLRESVTHIAETRGAVEKITNVMQTLRDVVNRR